MLGAAAQQGQGFGVGQGHLSLTSPSSTRLFLIRANQSKTNLPHRSKENIVPKNCVLKPHEPTPVCILQEIPTGFERDSARRTRKQVPAQDARCRHTWVAPLRYAASHEEHTCFTPFAQAEESLQSSGSQKGAYACAEGWDSTLRSFAGTQALKVP